MCGGKVGKIVSDVNPVKVFKNPVGQLKTLYNDSNSLDVGRGVSKDLGIDVMGKIVNGRRDAKLKAIRDAAFADQQATQAATDARASTAASYNADVITSKRRRKAGSLLARGGAGLDSSNSVLASAAVTGKSTLGA